MKKIPLVIIILLLTACAVEDESLDQKTFSTFEKLCKEQSSEFVDKGAAYGPVTIISMQEPSSPGPGKADRGVYDSEYDTSQLLKALLTGPDEVPQIRYVYQYYPYPTKAPKLYEDCDGYFYTDLTSLPFERVGLSECGQANKWNREADLTKYALSYDYGKLDENEIRPFTFRLIDTVTERVIVEQKSYQLLLGGLSVHENRSFTNGGWSQRVKTCKLTPPDLLIKQAFSKNCITTQSR